MDSSSTIGALNGKCCILEWSYSESGTARGTLSGECIVLSRGCVGVGAVVCLEAVFSFAFCCFLFCCLLFCCVVLCCLQLLFVVLCSVVDFVIEFNQLRWLAVLVFLVRMK